MFAFYYHIKSKKQKNVCIILNYIFVEVKLQLRLEIGLGKFTMKIEYINIAFICKYNVPIFIIEIIIVWFVDEISLNIEGGI